MIHTFEQRPPQLRAIQFDGTNVAEIAEFANIELPEVATDDTGRYFVMAIDRGWMGTMSIRVNETDWVHNEGLASVVSDADLQAGYKQVS